MFTDAGPTPYDLNFSLFGIHVRISPWFWVISTLFLWDSSISKGFTFLFVGIACFFISILVHELGHVLTGRLFGSDGYIVLHGFGGLAVGSYDVPRRWQRILVSLAGPLAQLVPCELLWHAILRGWIPLADLTDLQVYALSILITINWYWPMLNLLPVWPLDGGMIAREVLTGVNPYQGLRWSLGLSFACGALFAANALFGVMGRDPFIPWMPGSYWTLILFGMLAMSSYQALQQLGPPRNRPGRQEPERHAWERDPDYWK